MSTTATKNIHIELRVQPHGVPTVDGYFRRSEGEDPVRAFPGIAVASTQFGALNLLETLYTDTSNNLYLGTIDVPTDPTDPDWEGDWAGVITRLHDRFQVVFGTSGPTGTTAWELLEYTGTKTTSQTARSIQWLDGTDAIAFQVGTQKVKSAAREVGTEEPFLIKHLSEPDQVWVTAHLWLVFLLAD